MTREEAKRRAEVMMAYADGKDVELKIKGYDRWQPWNKEHSLDFDFDVVEYRVNKEPTYRPFKDKEECWAEMQKHQPFGWVIDKNTDVYHSIVALNSICPYFSSDCGDDYEHLFKYAVFADGTPFGIKED